MLLPSKRLWLTHYSPMITDPEEYAAQAQNIFPAAECGFDGKSITLQYEEDVYKRQGQECRKIKIMAGK